MGFGTTQEGIQGSGNDPFLSLPYLGHVRLIDVYKDEIEGKDGTIFPNVLKFKFKCLEEDVDGNNVKGHIIEKAEWPPRDDDSAEKNKNKSDRIGYIMKYFMDEEDVIIPQVDSWEQFVDIVVRRFEKNSGYSEVPVKLKVVGNVYNGVARLQIPNYKGFLQGKESESALSFSKKEMQDNRQYMEAQTLPSEGEPVGAGVEEADDLF